MRFYIIRDNKPHDISYPAARLLHARFSNVWGGVWVVALGYSFVDRVAKALGINLGKDML